MESDAMRYRLIAALLALVAAVSLRAHAPAPAPAPPPGPRYVAAYIEVRTGAESQAARLSSQYAAATRGAAGNMGADAFQEIDRPSRLLIVEAWKDQASLDAYHQGAGATGFRDRIKEIQRAPYDQRLHSGFAVDAAPATAGRDAVYVATHVDVPGARRQEAEVLLKTLLDASMRDTGRLRYEVYQQIDRPNHFTVFAGWARRAAFDASGMTPHALRFREALGPMLGALYDERLYRPLPR
jgi:quinol monooxygenase YgiN